LAVRSGNASHRPGREVDDNIMQPGKPLGHARPVTSRTAPTIGIRRCTSHAVH
jgi:hypothetical protein